MGRPGSEQDELNSALERLKGLEQRMTKLEEMQAEIRKDINDHADYIMALRAT